MNRVRTAPLPQLPPTNVEPSTDIAALRRELALLKEQQERSGSAPFNAEELVRSIMGQVGTMVSAHFEGLEARLLPEQRVQPPLPADAARESGVPATTLMAPANSGMKGRKKKSKKTSPKRAQTDAPKEVEPPPPAPSNAEGWNLVAKRGAKRKERRQDKKSVQKPNT
ncbi:unnamed protein product, partial [Brenthis ino]